MPKKIRPISMANFPAISTNCFGFATGNITPATHEETIYDLDSTLPISEAFIKKLSELGYDEFPRQIASLDEALDNEFVIMVYDFTPFRIRYPFVGVITYWNYHVVRRELDGTWVHKPGWDEPPCEVREEDWPKIAKEFGSKYVLFALASEA